MFDVVSFRVVFPDSLSNVDGLAVKICGPSVHHGVFGREDECRSSVHGCEDGSLLVRARSQPVEDDDGTVTL
jgi:hypothetical protein